MDTLDTKVLPDFLMEDQGVDEPVMIYPVSRRAHQWADAQKPYCDRWFLKGSAAIERFLMPLEVEGFYVKPL